MAAAQLEAGQDLMTDRMKARTIEVKALQEVALDPHHRGNR